MSRKNKNSNSNVVSRSAYEKSQYIWKWTTIIESLALSRFQWNNLPEGVSERFLERTLLTDGQAVFFDLNGVKMATRVLTGGRFNVYHDPTELTSIGDNSWYIPLEEESSVLIWDSLTRKNKYTIIQYFAEQLAEIDSIARTNRRQQRNLSIIQVPEESITDGYNLKKSLETGDWAIVNLKDTGISPIDLKSINLNIPYLQKELNEDKTSVLNELYSILGIEHIPFEKSERMITAEASVATDSIARMREDSIIPRQIAAEEINKKFGTNISVEWRTNQRELIESSYGNDEHNSSKDDDEND